MTRNRAIICLLVLLSLASGLSGAQTTPSFTLTASNITMPSSGVGSIPFTLTSVNGFSGTIYMSCAGPTVAAGVTVPLCETGGPAVGLVLNANATLNENIGLLASEPVPAPVKLNLKRHRGEASLALAGVLMLGLGLRRRRAYRFARVLVAAGVLIGLTAFGACGGSQKTLTPGNYTYTLAATDQGNPSPTVSATVTVSVPAGIVVQQ